MGWRGRTDSSSELGAAISPGLCLCRPLSCLRLVLGRLGRRGRRELELHRLHRRHDWCGSPAVSAAATP
jgi:hypothetical protein